MGDDHVGVGFFCGVEGGVGDGEAYKDAAYVCGGVADA